MANVTLSFKGRLISMYPLGAQPVTIGRALECDIPIDSLAVGPRHALISAHPDGYSIDLVRHLIEHFSEIFEFGRPGKFIFELLRMLASHVNITQGDNIRQTRIVQPARDPATLRSYTNTRQVDLFIGPKHLARHNRI